MNANQSALNSFLSKFEIVTSADMTFKNGIETGGFQEQIVMTPEPRAGGWILLSLLVGSFLVMRRSPTVYRTAAVNSKFGSPTMAHWDANTRTLVAKISY